MHALLHVILALVAFWLISGTVLNFSKHPHWYIRGWDFPRVFTAAVSAALLVLYAIFFSTGPWWNVVVMAGLVFVIGRQLYMIYPYTPLGTKRVKRAAQQALFKAESAEEGEAGAVPTLEADTTADTNGD